MSLRQSIVDGLNRAFRWRGMELRPLTPPAEDSSMSAGLARAAALVPDLGTVIDVGAAAGKWTRLALPHFGRARFLLVEPLQERVGELTALSQEHARVQFVSAVAGAGPGEVAFHVAEDLDGSGVREGAGRRAPVIALAEEVASRRLPGPYFIKLDTHGFELPILEGALPLLAETALLMIEAYNFELMPGSFRFHQLCAWLEPHGFRPCDVLEPLRRPGDGLLWQFDLVFARRDHPVFTRATYR